MTAVAAAQLRGPRGRRYSMGMLVLAAVVIAVPFLPFISYSIIGRANLAGQYALIAISLVILTGWVGQVSLGHAAFVGVGAYVTGLAQESWSIGFPANLLTGAVAGAIAAALLGIVALRVRGLYLAVATLIFSWTADAFLFQQEWLTKHSFISLDPIGEPGAVPSLNFGERKTFYFAVWATVAVVMVLVANLRDRKIGRAFFAIRGSEMAAASLGIDVVRTKLVAFAISGALAGMAGSLTLIGSQVVTPEQFSLTSSLFFLAIAVVGGLTSLPGAVAAGLLFAGLEELFFRVPSVGAYLQLVSAVLLAVVLLLYPGGLGALGQALGRRLGQLQARLARPQAVDAGELAVVPAEVVEEETHPFRNTRFTRAIYDFFKRFTTRLETNRLAKRQARETAQILDFSRFLEGGTAAHEPPVNGNGSGAHVEVGEDYDPEAEDDGPTLMAWETMDFEGDRLPVENRHLRRPLIEAEHIVVRFGGLTAVNDVSLTVREGEIVGLIGPNGAGKTTLFNSIAGFNTPTEGRVRIFGHDVTPLPVYLRSRFGVARTFQAIQLFPQLDVFENLLVATYLADNSGLVGSMLATNGSLRAEMTSRRRVSQVVQLLGLEDVADRTVAELPFGVLRMVEIARALVTGAPVVMLDEPASGLDEVETERLSKLVRFIRSLGVTVLLIEHDVKMVTGLSDYMYVIDRGEPIAEGTPEEIKRNPAVISAYLGEETHDEEEAVAAAATT